MQIGELTFRKAPRNPAMKLMGITDHLSIVFVTRIAVVLHENLEKVIAIVAVARTQKQASEINHRTKRWRQDVMSNDSQEDIDHQ
jgi:hypothetical protein